MQIIVKIHKVSALPFSATFVESTSAPFQRKQGFGRGRSDEPEAKHDDVCQAQETSQCKQPGSQFHVVRYVRCT